MLSGSLIVDIDWGLVNSDTLGLYDFTNLRDDHPYVSDVRPVNVRYDACGSVPPTRILWHSHR